VFTALWTNLKAVCSTLDEFEMTLSPNLVALSSTFLSCESVEHLRLESCSGNEVNKARSLFELLSGIKMQSDFINNLRV
jgi:hypothetical protein